MDLNMDYDLGLFNIKSPNRNQMDYYGFIWDMSGKNIPIEVNMVIKIGYIHFGIIWLN